MVITNAIITAYCACTICCGKHHNGVTASGAKPVEGVTIAASRKIKLGTHVVVDGHEYVVQDRLAKKYDSRFDVYFASHKDAQKFGLQHHNVVVMQ